MRHAIGVAGVVFGVVVADHASAGAEEPSVVPLGGSGATFELAIPAAHAAESAPLDGVEDDERDDDLDEDLEDEEDDLLDMDLGQLRSTSVAPAFDEVVTTVSRTASTVGRSPAAVFVITQEMIRRSGARSLPEVLRMAPGVQVARVTSGSWSVSIRGFAGGFSNKLLVQIDGRSVYNNGFAGVYWDSVDVVLDNIERIEVIRGPGASVWGANAVNGIINVITKKADDTRGAYALIGGGTEEQGFASTWVGGSSSDGRLKWRAWGKWFERDGGFLEGGENADGWRQGRAGVRLDYTPDACSRATLEAAGYGGASGYEGTQPLLGTLLGDEEKQGAFVRGEWTRDYGDDGSFYAQLYYDQQRHSDLLVDQLYEVLNLDLHRQTRPSDAHNVVYGFRYRLSEDKLNSATDPEVIGFDDPSRTVNLVSVFLQDEVTLAEDALYFTAGTKLEHNDLTGVEVQPTARLLAILDDRRVAWAAFSRAVRTPGTLERYATVTFAQVGPDFVQKLPNPLLDAEVLLAYELGYRAQPFDWFSWDTALFYFDYDRLVTTTSTGALTSTNTNDATGSSYGAEFSGTLDITPDWRLSGHYTVFQGDTTTASTQSVLDRASQNVVYLRSAWDLSECWELDLITRYSDVVTTMPIDAYLTMDVRLAWRPSRNCEIAVVGQNLLDAEHQEFDGFPVLGTEVQRGVYVSATWRR